MWTAEEVNQLNKMRRSHTIHEIAVALGKSPLDVQNKLIASGFKPYEKPAPEQPAFDIGRRVEIPQRKKRVQVTPEIEQRVVQLRKQRFNFEEIAKKTGVSQSTASRIAQRHGLPSEKRQVERTTKEPAPVAAETSSENIKTHSNITPSAAICKDLIKEAKATLENAEPRKTLNSIGKALGYIEAALKIWEE